MSSEAELREQVAGIPLRWIWKEVKIRDLDGLLYAAGSERVLQIFDGKHWKDVPEVQG